MKAFDPYGITFEKSKDYLIRILLTVRAEEIKNPTVNFLYQQETSHTAALGNCPKIIELVQLEDLICIKT